MRALLCSTSGAGHLGPTLAFARALRASGTEVAFVVPATLADTLAGWEVVVADDPPAAATAALWARVAQAPEEAARLVNGELFGELCTTAMLPAVARACTELEPAFLLHEPCAYAAPIAAARRGLPSAQVAISLAEVEDGSLAHAAPALESIEPGIVERLRNAPYLTRFPAALDPRRSPTPGGIATTSSRSGQAATWRHFPTGGQETNGRSSTPRSVRRLPAGRAPRRRTARSRARRCASTRGCW